MILVELIALLDFSVTCSCISFLYCLDSSWKFNMFFLFLALTWPLNNELANNVVIVGLHYG